MGNLKKIVITGPESSGKSELCTALSDHFKTEGVKEYARTYLEEKGPDYQFDDFEAIFKGHVARQEEALKKAGELIFLDTDMVNFYVWAKKVFGMIPDWVDTKLKAETDHLYLITAPDIPWVKDPLRHNPHTRQLVFKEHRELIESLKRPYKIIEGSGKARLQNAIAAVEKLLS